MSVFPIQLLSVFLRKINILVFGDLGLILIQNGNIVGWALPTDCSLIGFLTQFEHEFD